MAVLNDWRAHRRRSLRKARRRAQLRRLEASLGDRALPIGGGVAAVAVAAIGIWAWRRSRVSIRLALDVNDRPRGGGDGYYTDRDDDEADEYTGDESGASSVRSALGGARSVAGRAGGRVAAAAGSVTSRVRSRVPGVDRVRSSVRSAGATVGHRLSDWVSSVGERTHLLRRRGERSEGGEEGAETTGAMESPATRPLRALEDAVIEAFLNDPVLQGQAIDIGADTADTIELSGTVDTAELRDVAERIAEGVPGVVTVHNLLRIESLSRPRANLRGGRQGGGGRAASEGRRDRTGERAQSIAVATDHGVPRGDHTVQDGSSSPVFDDEVRTGAPEVETVGA